MRKDILKHCPSFVIIVSKMTKKNNKTKGMSLLMGYLIVFHTHEECGHSGPQPRA